MEQQSSQYAQTQQPGEPGLEGLQGEGAKEWQISAEQQDIQQWQQEGQAGQIAQQENMGQSGQPPDFEGQPAQGGEAPPQNTGQSGFSQQGHLRDTLPQLLEQAIFNQRALDAAHSIAQQAKEALGERLLQEQLEEISRLDEQVQTFEDLTQMESFEEFNRMVCSGQDLVSAFKAANFDKLMARQTAWAKRQAYNETAAKQHFTPLPGTGQGAGGAEIPEHALPLWQEVFPGEDGLKLRERYNRAKERA